MAKDKGGGGGGSKPSGGGGGGGGGGGSKPAPAAAPTPAPKPAATPPPSSGGGNKPSQAVTAATIYKAAQSSAPSKPSTQSSRPTDTPTKPSTQSSGGSSPSNQQNRVQQLTQKAKTLIGGATSEGIADPGKFKDILGKLKDLGKEGRVENLRTQKKEAVTTAKNALTPPPLGSNDDNDNATSFTGYSQEELDELLGSLQEGYGEKISGLESQIGDLMGQFGKQQQQQQQQQSQDTGGSEYQDWLTSFATEQDKGAFDPNLFNRLLGELESSKRRQKDWSERSAKAAYKY